MGGFETSWAVELEASDCEAIFEPAAWQTGLPQLQGWAARGGSLHCVGRLRVDGIELARVVAHALDGTWTVREIRHRDFRRVQRRAGIECPARGCAEQDGSSVKSWRGAGLAAESAAAAPGVMHEDARAFAWWIAEACDLPVEKLSCAWQRERQLSRPGYR